MKTFLMIAEDALMIAMGAAIALDYPWWLIPPLGAVAGWLRAHYDRE